MAEPTVKKKVLLVIRWPVGGIRTFLRYVYRNFDPLAWSFTIIAPDLNQMKILMDDLKDFEVQFMPVYGIPADGSSGFWRMFGAVSLQLMAKKFSLVHSHGFTSGMCSALPAFIRRIPHLMTAHDVINKNQFAGFKGQVKWAIVEQLYKFIDKIQSVSVDAQNNLFEYFPSLAKNKEKCFVIFNGIEVERFIDAPPRNLRRELKLSENVFLIGFMGRFMAQKGFRYLVDAIEILRSMNNLPKRPLVLTFGWGGFIREEKQSLINRGMEDYFCFMPFTPNIAGTIKGLDVVVMPSLWEACGLLAMETLVAGTPLIGSDCIGLREVLQDTPARVVPKADANGLAVALSHEILSTTKALFLEYRDMAAERFDVKKSSQSLLEVYEQMVSSK